MLRPQALVALVLLLLPSIASATGTPRCEPRSPTEWAGGCLGSDGRAEIAGLLPEVRRHPLFSGIGSAEEACLLLRPGSADSECERARRQLFALALNVAAGRLGPDCCVDSGGHPRRIRGLLDGDAEDCRAGARCAEIRELAAAINSGERVVPCDGAPGGGPAPGSGDGCCRPRSKGFWHRQCLGIGALTPGRSENGRGPGVHPAFSEAELREILRRADRRLGGRCGGGACAALDEENHRTARGRAEAQLAALVLNQEAGYLRGCAAADDLLRRCERLMDEGRWDECARLADEANNGRSVPRCAGDREDEDGDEHRHDGDDDRDDHPGNGQSKDKDKGKDKGKAKGKG